jgi:putative ABC transport system permease protein
MLKNYIKIAFRNLWRQKGYTFINIAGLASGIAICFVIFLWTQDELHYEQFHEHSERIYRSLWEAKFGDNEWVIPAVPVPVGTTLRGFPEVDQVTNLVVNSTRVVRTGDEFIRQSDVIFAEPNVFDVFTFRFLSGNPETALMEPNSVVLTDETAQRFFGGKNALGQSLELNNGDLLTVTAVVEQWPDQSHIKFTMIQPLSTVPWVQQRSEQWGSASVRTYFTMYDPAQITALQEKLDTYVEENVNTGGLMSAPGNYNRYPSQALSDIHLYSRSQFGMDAGGDIRYVYLFSVIGIFILLLACINFINLTTARSAGRLKEIGLRKVLGSGRPQLIGQFLAESFIYVIIALLLALLVTELTLPYFNDLAGKQMRVDYFASPDTFLLFIGLSLVVGFLAGFYPALVLSSFIPIRAIKGQPGEKSPNNYLRNTLVVTQFGVSITLIIGTIVVHKQLQFMQETNPGFDKEQVVVIQGAGVLGGRHDIFIQELEAAPGIVSASAVQTLPGYEFDSTLFTIEQPANYEQTSLNYTMVDYNFVDVMGLNIVQGRNFSRDFATDSLSFMINEKAALALGWDQPIGNQLTTGGIAGPVIGVVEDFHYESLHSDIQPLVFLFIRWTPQLIAVRLEPGRINEHLAVVSGVWSEFLPLQPVNYSFLDQNLQSWYVNEFRVAGLFRLFTLLAIIIACLGLFGLAAYTTETRTKEIGIRKVLGATGVRIAAMLSGDFIRLVMLAFVIAVPVGWLAMNYWLQGFAYRIEISWWIIALAGIIAFVIALLTVSAQAIKAAMMNPVKSLRSE